MDRSVFYNAQKQEKCKGGLYDGKTKKKENVIQGKTDKLQIIRNGKRTIDQICRRSRDDKIGIYTTATFREKSAKKDGDRLQLT